MADEFPVDENKSRSLDFSGSLDSLIEQCHFLKPALDSKTSYRQEVEKLKDWYLPSVSEKSGRVFGKFDSNYPQNVTHLNQIVSDFILLSDLVSLPKDNRLRLHQQSSFLVPSSDILGARLGLTIAAGSEILNYFLGGFSIPHFLAVGGLAFTVLSILRGTVRQDYEFLKDTASKVDNYLLQNYLSKDNSCPEPAVKI